MDDSSKPRRIADYVPRLEGLDAIAYFLGVSPDTVQRRIADAGLPVARDESGRVWTTEVDLVLWKIRKQGPGGGWLLQLLPGVLTTCAASLGISDGREGLHLGRRMLNAANEAAAGVFESEFNQRNKTYRMLRVEALDPDSESSVEVRPITPPLNAPLRRWHRHQILARVLRRRDDDRHGGRPLAAFEPNATTGPNRAARRAQRRRTSTE